MHRPSENKFRPMKSLKCDRCQRVVNSDMIQVGQKHKACGTSPHGYLVSQVKIVQTGRPGFKSIITI